jgi:hypothetical protein
VGEPVSAGELVVFEESNAGPDDSSRERHALRLGVRRQTSACAGDRPLLRPYLAAALRAGEREIRRIGSELAAAGIIR